MCDDLCCRRAYRRGFLDGARVGYRDGYEEKPLLCSCRGFVPVPLLDSSPDLSFVTKPVCTVRETIQQVIQKNKERQEELRQYKMERILKGDDF